jgi:pimeloyl-ACP methyl ester carboxylesterase
MSRTPAPALAAAALRFAEPQPLPAAAPIHAHVLPGSGRRLVVALAGVGTQRSLPPPPEFPGTATMRGENHVMFLADDSRSWMNAPGAADTIVRLIEEYRAAHGIDEVVALGNSMGGFAALRLAELTEIRTAIAFAPQFSMQRELVPEEHRWQYHAGRIGHWRFADVGRLDTPGTRYFILHGDAPEEAWHWLRFPWRPQVNHFILGGQGHNVARLLQKRRLLAQVVELSMLHKPRMVRRLLQRTFLGSGLPVARREHYDAAPLAAKLSGGAPVVLPAAQGPAT